MGVHIADSSLTHAIQVSNTKYSMGHGRQLQETLLQETLLVQWVSRDEDLGLEYSVHLMMRMYIFHMR
jgi:hypothetical protein